MKLELNEINKVEKTISKGEVDNKPSSTIRLLARYYNEQGMDMEQIIKAIDTFMLKNYSHNYNSVTWGDMVEGIIKRAIKDNKKLVQIDCVNITNSEINYIKSLENDKFQRLAFVYLVYAKILNQMNLLNNNWVNGKYRNEIFKDAFVKELGKDQHKTIHSMSVDNIIKLSKNITNNSVDVSNYINEDDTMVFEICDFRELGLQWMQYMGDKNIKACKLCNKLIKQNIYKSRKYCYECAKKTKQEQVNKLKRDKRNGVE